MKQNHFLQEPQILTSPNPCTPYLKIIQVVEISYIGKVQSGQKLKLHLKQEFIHKMQTIFWQSLHYSLSMNPLKKLY